MDQVDDSVHHSLKGKRNTATLYVGNLNASKEDLRESLSNIFKRIRVENITIPRVNGLSKYGFIGISWAHQAPLKPVDLCITFSGRIKLNPGQYTSSNCGRRATINILLIQQARALMDSSRAMKMVGLGGRRRRRRRRASPY